MQARTKLIRLLTNQVTAVFAAALLLASSVSPILTTANVSAATTPQNVPKISFTFDDGLQSTYTTAEPTLAKYGLTGTEYVITGCVGMTTVPNTCNANNDATYMTWDQIKALQADGWEIGSHTEDHECMASSAETDSGCANATPLTAAQLDTELGGSQQILQQELGSTATTDFAWPYGDYDNLSLSVAAKYYATTRGFADDDGNTLNGPVANNTTDVTTGSYAYNDLLLHDQQMQASPVPPTWQICSTFTNGAFTVAQAEQCIDNAIANNQWLVLVFHNITATPDLSAADSSYDQSTSNLDAIAAYAAAKQAAGLAKVVNINSGIVTGANMMPNGEFQAGLADGWTTDDPTDITLDTNDNGRYPDPTNSILLKSAAGATSTSATHLFSPQISVTPGQTYDLKNYLNMLAGGSVNFYIDEYNSSGQWISGVDPSAGMAYSAAANATDVGDVDFSYTPSSASVAKASLQVIVKGVGVDAYYSGAQWFIPGSTSTPTTPTISAVASTTNGPTSATVTWATNEPTTSMVNYGTSATYGSSTPADSTLTTTHSVSVTGLTANTTYHFQAVSTDASNNTVTSSDYTFTTPTSTAIPGDINGDGKVDALDLSVLLSNWGKTGATAAQGDLNGDGTVDALDLSILLTNWSN
ncbi:MAG TPA: polysaccharide deacetylase family protein [Verrucomicrobiae bacterium]|nr:polysaccharide deacetylase family protein [Verrucomicrobiae bacterium]